METLVGQGKDKKKKRKIMGTSLMVPQIGCILYLISLFSFTTLILIDKWLSTCQQFNSLKENTYSLLLIFLNDMGPKSD